MDPPAVEVPAGFFIRGSLPGRGELDELPARRVSIPRYSIDSREVDVASYRRCVAAGACNAAKTAGYEWYGQPYKRSGFCNFPARPRHPMNCVSWRQAWAYCCWIGRRLPTEAEWEKAARGTDGRLFPWGNALPGPGARLGNFADETAKKTYPSWSTFAGYDDGYVGTAPVGSFPLGRSPYGALDLAGNVWEWVLDWYGERAYTMVGGEQRGPGYGELRVIRGGSFESHPEHIRTTERSALRPTDRSYFVGFRCAATPRPGR